MSSHGVELHADVVAVVAAVVFVKMFMRFCVYLLYVRGVYVCMCT